MPWIEVPDNVSPTAYLVCVGLAVLVMAVAKGGFGGGIGILSVPLMVAVNLPAQRALGMMLPLLILGDISSLLHHRGNQSRRHLGWLVLGALLGIVLATVLLFTLAKATDLSRALNLLVGGLCLLIVLAQVWRMLGLKVPRIPGTPIAGYGSGALAGFLSTLAQSAGPVTNIYLLEQGLDKRRQVGTSVYFYLVNNVAKVPSYVALTYITWPTLRESLIYVPLIPAGTWLGAWMHKRLDERPFNAIMYLGAAAAAGHMIYKGLA